MDANYKYVGNFSAVDPAYTRMMYCDDCMVSWHGRWDNFQCPKCGEGELPNNNLEYRKKPDPIEIPAGFKDDDRLKPLISKITPNRLIKQYHGVSK